MPRDGGGAQGAWRMGGCPHGGPGGVGWAGAPCPELLPSSEFAVFLPRRNNFLLPWPRAQDLREEVLGRSFALSEPDDYAVAPWQRGSSPRPSPGPRPAGLQGPDTG